MGLFVLGTAGCSSMVSPGEAGVQTADVAFADSAADDAVDEALPDVAPDVADAGNCDATGDQAAYIACCEAINWDFNRGCAAWGPFVPPSMDEHEGGEVRA